jgi:hypothetical protein
VDLDGWMSLSGIINSHLIMAFTVARAGTGAQRRPFPPRIAAAELRGGIAPHRADCATDLKAIRPLRDARAGSIGGRALPMRAAPTLGADFAEAVLGVIGLDAAAVADRRARAPGEQLVQYPSTTELRILSVETLLPRRPDHGAPARGAGRGLDPDQRTAPHAGRRAADVFRVRSIGSASTGLRMLSETVSGAFSTIAARLRVGAPGRRRAKYASWE